MNIAIFSPSQNPYSETFIQAHKNELKGRVFYYYGRGSQIKLEGYARLMPIWRYKYLMIYAKIFRKPSGFLWQEQLLYSLKLNNINTILVEYGTHAYHLKELLAKSRLPVVVHFHGYDASVRRVIKSCNYYKDVFENAKKIIAVSRIMETTLLSLGCPKDKLIYNVYGPQKIFETITPQFSKKQFVAIGRFTNKKAPYYTILAFKEVLKIHPDAQLLMAGDGLLLNTCKNLVQHYQLSKQVKFLGVITAEMYSDLLKESLAFVQHSITAEDGDMEGTPLSVLEASAAGLPVIATNHAGIPDVIVNNETGLLGDEHNVIGMTENMLQLLNNLELAKQLGIAGKARIKTHFSLERHINNLNAVLDPKTI
ncbi:glycosyltransferase [Neotamlana sedimentorum]|uniref:glycosyltransferase n=1 Tax=Neotamlana sedimentorum TaxID=1435349 RepID=UPI00069B5D62|nr:glycosyltransferase [Tamlana sedimentorum]